MNRLKLTLLALLAAGMQFAPAAYAQSARTWVSGKGSDSSTCALGAPCRTFAYAITQTNAGGEIDVLDPAGYGAVTITKAISIVNDGVGEAGVLASVSGTSAITINAGPSDVIHLRGLTIEGAGVATNGVVFNQGASLTIADCVIRHFANEGVNIAPTSAMTFFISNGLMSDNGNTGIVVSPQGAGAAKGVIDGVAANSNAIGIFIDGSGTPSGSVVDVTIANSVAANNTDFGINAYSQPGHATAMVLVRNSDASNNSIDGIFAQNNTVVRLAQTVATANSSYGVSISGGTVYSYGDNDINGNITGDVSASLTPVATR